MFYGRRGRRLDASGRCGGGELMFYGRGASKAQAEAGLDLARGEGTVHDAEVGRAEYAAGYGEISVVQGVEELAAELEAQVFPDAEIALHRKIRHGDAGGAQNVAAFVAELELRRLKEGGGVEPLRRWALIRGESRIAHAGGGPGAGG